jgi:hypothetical protein
MRGYGLGAVWIFVAACGGSAFTTDETGAGGAGDGNDAGTTGQGGSEHDAGAMGAGGSAKDAAKGGGAGIGGAASGSGGTGSGAGGTGSAGSSGGGIDSGSADAPADGQACSQSADETLGVMVAPSSSGSGTDAAACGTKSAPCTSVQKAIATAVAANKSFVYLAAGTYYEDDIALAEGVTLAGGFGPDWSRRCAPSPTATILRNTVGTKVVSAVDLGGRAVLDSLTLKSKPPSAVGTLASGAGESLYGLFAMGATTTVNLVNVRIEVGHAGKGVDGATASDASPAAPAGSCPAPNSTSAGQPGAAGTDGSGAVAGTFTLSGYAPSSGTDGTSGTQGGDGTTTSPARGSCTTCAINGTSDGCDSSFTAQAGGAASEGCGGNPGGFGMAGGGGGSSVAVFAADARVVVSGGQLIAGDGGAGGNGSLGKAGGAGSAGVAGATVTCASTCCFGTAATCSDAVLASASDGAGGAMNLAAPAIGLGGIICVGCPTNACFATGAHTIAGGDATSGALGGPGGTGGGGAGGMSYGVVKVGAATVSLGDGTVVVHGQQGNGGTGAAAGSDGASADVLP